MKANCGLVGIRNISPREEEKISACKKKKTNLKETVDKNGYSLVKCDLSRTGKSQPNEVSSFP